MAPIKDENGNINCLYCRNCTNCENCIGCINCVNCENCTNCKDCTNCRKCIDIENCTECNKCTNCKGCLNCSHCDGAIFKKSIMGYKDFELYDKNHLVFPNKGRCQYSEKIESFFLIQGLIPYQREPKNTNYTKKSKAELLEDNIDVDELQSIYDSQGVQIAWNIGRLYKRYWITKGKHRAKYTLHDLALFLIMNKLVISERTIQDFTGMREVPYDLRMFQREFQSSFYINNLQHFL